MDPIRIVLLKPIYGRQNSKFKSVRAAPSQKKVGEPKTMRPPGSVTYEPT